MGRGRCRCDKCRQSHCGFTAGVSSGLHVLSCVVAFERRDLPCFVGNRALFRPARWACPWFSSKRSCTSARSRGRLSGVPTWRTPSRRSFDDACPRRRAPGISGSRCAPVGEGSDTACRVRCRRHAVSIPGPCRTRGRGRRDAGCADEWSRRKIPSRRCAPSHRLSHSPCRTIAVFDINLDERYARGRPAVLTEVNDP